MVLADGVSLDPTIVVEWVGKVGLLGVLVGLCYILYRRMDKAEQAYDDLQKVRIAEKDDLLKALTQQHKEAA